MDLSAEIAELSERLARSEALAREQAAAIAHYRKMYDRSSALAEIGVWECDLSDDRLSWTDGVYDLFELPRGSPLDRAAIVELYDEKSRQEMERLRAKAIRDGTGFSLDIHVRTAKGNDRWLRLTADVEREKGRSVRIFGTKQNITEEKAAQERVRSLQAELIHMSRQNAMGAMAAALAHELNQPLAAIINYLAGTRRSLALANPALADIEDGLDAIEACASRASNIIRSFRAMSDGSNIRRQPIDPDPLIREAGALALARVDGDAQLRFELADGLLLFADPIQVQQVLINLIKNAAEAVQAGAQREIVVSTRRAGSNLVILVEDTGPGIPDDMLPLPFDSTISSKPEGMGIGLSVSRTIVEAHGGRISAANRPEGGAAFSVELPLIAIAADPAVGSARAAAEPDGDPYGTLGRTLA